MYVDKGSETKVNIAWLTDLHLNFLKQNQVDSFFQKLSKEPVDCFFISGDIAEANSIVDHLEHMASVVEKPIYFVLGNHDYYDGSIRNVRAEIADLVRQPNNLFWLNAVDFISLSEQTALLGHDSWADGRLGNIQSSRVELNDFRMIEELQIRDNYGRAEVMQQLADQAARHFCKVLPGVLKNYQHSIVITHVPPFKEACWHEGQQLGDDWLPFFSCKVVGDVLKDMMEQHPSCEMIVYCGHTHGSGECQILPNLKVFTGRALYGAPHIQSIIEVT